MSSTHRAYRLRSVSAGISSLLVSFADVRGPHRQGVHATGCNRRLFLALVSITLRGLVSENVNTLLAVCAIFAAGFPAIVIILQQQLAKRIIHPGPPSVISITSTSDTWLP